MKDDKHTIDLEIDATLNITDVEVDKDDEKTVNETTDDEESADIQFLATVNLDGRVDEWLDSPADSIHDIKNYNNIQNVSPLMIGGDENKYKYYLVEFVDTSMSYKTIYREKK